MGIKTSKYGKIAISWCKDFIVVIKKNSKASLIVFILLFAFVWFQLRPIYVYRKCDNQAVKKATETLKTRAQMDSISNLERERYEDFVAKDMHLIDDYDRYYERCLQRYGLHN